MRVRAVAEALISIAVAQAVLDHGGFSTTAQVVFVLLGAGAVAASIRSGARGAARAALHPLVVVLLALAALSALSALWTAGLAENALEAALLPAGCALLVAAVLAASTRDRTRVRSVVLVTVCGCAFASGIVGLIAAATFSEPAAFSPNGIWRPAGTLEYTAALTLLQVCALPALLRALAAGGSIARLASAPAAVAGALFGLSASRVGVAMALGVGVATIAAPRLTACTTRTRALLAVVFVAFAAAAARATLGGAVEAGSDAPGWRLAVVVALCAGAPLAWSVIEVAARRSVRTVLVFAVAALVACTAASPVADTVPAAGSAAVARGQRQARADPNDALHGRGNIWSAGVRAFVRRPLQGYGAGAFGSATLEFQHPAVTAYAHDLPLELGVELGLLGAALGLALYVLVVRAAWQARAVAGAWPLLVPALAFLVANMVDWPWHIAGMAAIWAIVTAALIAAARGPELPQRKGVPHSDSVAS